MRMHFDIIVFVFDLSSQRVKCEIARCLRKVAFFAHAFGVCPSAQEHVFFLGIFHIFHISQHISQETFAGVLSY